MMILFYMFTLLATAQESEPFVCNPPEVIKDRVNEHCNQSSQYSINYRKPEKRTIKNGVLYFTSVDTEHDGIVLQMAHQCRGQKVSEWKKFANFCGYEIASYDRETPFIRTIRADLARENGLNERQHHMQIDRLIALQMNPWLADPKKNIFERDGKVIIKILTGRHGITCHTSNELTYEPNCK